MRVAVASLNQWALDFEGNFQRIKLAAIEAKRQGASIVLTPELSITSYGCEDYFHHRWVVVRAAGIARRVMGLACDLDMTILVGLPVHASSVAYNAVLVAHSNGQACFVLKQRLAGETTYYEPRWFRALSSDRIELDDFPDITAGRGIIEDPSGVRIAVEICEDAWVADRPAVRYAKDGVDVIFNASGSHFAVGKHEKRVSLVTESTRAFSCAYVYSNLLGMDAGRLVYDGDSMISTGGKLFEVQGLGSADVQVISADVDIEVNRTKRRRMPSYAPSEAIERLQVFDSDFSFPAREPRTTIPTPVRRDVHEEVLRALSLGSLDYMRRSGCRGFVLSLSGGADSTLCALIARDVAERLWEERGGCAPEWVAYWPQMAEIIGRVNVTVDDIMGLLLTTVYQKAEGSSEKTRLAAEAVAKEMCSVHYDIDVQECVEGVRGLYASTVGRPLNWKDDDIALQNCTARFRAQIPWMLANEKNALLVTTSNRSEAAVGYSTMDGDTAGGFSMINGINKCLVLSVLRYFGQFYPSVAAVSSLQPSAELRPGGGQYDEDDLMPFPVLLALERAFVVDGVAPDGLVSIEVPGFGNPTLAQVRLFMFKFMTAQWKRERYAPGIHIEDNDLDSRSWFRGAITAFRPSL